MYDREKLGTVFIIFLLAFLQEEPKSIFTLTLQGSEYTTKLDEKCCGVFKSASRLTTLACQAKGPVKLSLVRFILYSTWDWSIDYLRGTFGV